MLIGYDGRFITSKLTGNGTYAIHLIETISEIDNSNHFRLYLPGPYDASNINLKRNVQIRELHPIYRSAWFRVPILYPLELLRHPVDIFHAHYTIPLWTRTKVVMTLHDFFWLIYPDQFVSIKRFPVTLTIKNSVERADCILVGTNYIKQETINYFGIPEEHISVIPYGIDNRFFKHMDCDHIRRICNKYGIQAPYILAVGDIHPRKNLRLLLEALALSSELDNFKIVLTGKPLWKTKELYGFIKKTKLEDRIVFTGYVSDEDLPGIYQGAELFCYPSLYEGFGFPILEAMASGVPVVASNTTSCPEVGGDAALYFDPTSVEDLAARVDEALTDSTLRDERIKMGIDWAKTFCWRKTAKKTLSIYKSLA